MHTLTGPSNISKTLLPLLDSAFFVSFFFSFVSFSFFCFFCSFFVSFFSCVFFSFSFSLCFVGFYAGVSRVFVAARVVGDAAGEIYPRLSDRRH